MRETLTERDRQYELTQELNLRKGARNSLTEFTTFTYPGYQTNWHHEEIAGFLQLISWKKLATNLMIFAPPRHGKSEMAAIRWPAWDLGGDPSQHFIATAYGDELARTFSRACRNVTQSPAYQRLWRHKLKEQGDTKWQLVRENDDQRASYISAGILSSLTGEGATKLLIDDPVKNAEEAYSKVIRQKVWDNYLTAANTRLAPGGRKVLIMTRWHEDDLAGRLLKLALENKAADQWTVLSLAATNDSGEDSFIWDTRTGKKRYFKPYRALWPERYSREDLDRLKATLGSVFWNALYMQRPSAPEGGLFKRENWTYHDNTPACDFIVQIWDTAHAEGQDNDYSATITLGVGGGKFPVLDAFRSKMGFPALVASVYERWALCKARYGRVPDRLLVENKGSGISLIQQLTTNNQLGMWVHPDGTVMRVPIIPVVPMPATVSKFVRAQGVVGYHESKMVSLPRGADWVEDFIDEHALFDKGPHDDWVDTLVHGMTWMVHGVKTDEEENIVVHDPQEEIQSELSPMDEFDLRMKLTSW